MKLVGPGGFLVYETFGIGNERFGRPSNADFLLTPNELRDSVGNEFLIVDEFFGEVRDPQPAVGPGSSQDELTYKMNSLSSKAFVGYLGARIAIGIANTMLIVALGWHLYEITGDPWSLALVGLMQIIPVYVFLCIGVRN